MELPEFLSRDAYGGLRLAGHRVSLHQLLWYYNQGHSAEMLLGQFPSLPLALIHKVLAFYLENQAEVDAEMAQTQARLDQQRASGTQVDVLGLRARQRAAEAARATATSAE